MYNDKVIDEMLARIQTLEEKVEVLSQQILVEDANKDKDSDKNQKRCLPGYNSCDIN